MINNREKLRFVKVWAKQWRQRDRFDPTFINSLADQYDAKGRLSASQTNALNNIINKWQIPLYSLPTEETIVKKVVPDVSSDDDEVECVEVQNISRTCPLTQGLLEHPVRSTLCGHMYSEKAIKAHIEVMRSRAKCPVAGCRHFVCSKNLEALDEQTKDDTTTSRTSQFEIIECW